MLPRSSTYTTIVVFVAAFDPLTLTVGGISYVATGAQVGVAIASLGALALAAEGLLLAEISRGRRDTNTVSSHKLDPLFDAIGKSNFQFMISPLDGACL